MGTPSPSGMPSLGLPCRSMSVALGQERFLTNGLDGGLMAVGGRWAVGAWLGLGLGLGFGFGFGLGLGFGFGLGLGVKARRRVR